MTRWTVAQIGAREHYAVPVGFRQQNSLRHLYTDVWCPAWLRWTARLPAPARHFAARRTKHVPDREVTAFNLAAISDRLTHSRLSNSYADYIRIGEIFAERVAGHLRRIPLDPLTDAFFSYNTGCLETLQLLNDLGIPSIVDQIDPARVEMEIVQEESERWPGWEVALRPVPESYWQRLAAEWKAASLVMVNSNWSREALVQQGVPREKLLVVPLSYELSADLNRQPIGIAEGLTVLWLGTVCLRKGIPYLIDAARQLQSYPSIRFLVAGPVEISKEAIDSAPGNIRFTGRIPRGSASDLYRCADLFVIPTLSDGFAITQLEAMAAGVPVIATPHCGQVVTDQVDGLIVPPRSGEAIASAILSLHADRPRLRSMGESAKRKSAQFSPSVQAQRMTDALEALRKRA